MAPAPRAIYSSDGGARHWALVASLVASAKLNGVEPLAWLTDVLEQMVSGRTKAHVLERLLPWPGRRSSSRVPSMAERPDD
jgi:transposase